MSRERQVAIVGVGQTNFGALYHNKDAFRDALIYGNSIHDDAVGFVPPVKFEFVRDRYTIFRLVVVINHFLPNAARSA